MNLANNVKVTRLMNGVAAGTTEQVSSALNMAGFEGVTFLVALGAITAGAATSVKVQQSSDDAATDAYSDLTGTSITYLDTDDNKVAVIDIVHPVKQYLKVAVERATQNAVIDGIIAVQYGARKLPTTNDSTTVVSRETWPSPAEGTA